MFQLIDWCKTTITKSVCLAPGAGGLTLRKAILKNKQELSTGKKDGYTKEKKQPES